MGDNKPFPLLPAPFSARGATFVLVYPCWTHLAQCHEYGLLAMTVDWLFSMASFQFFFCVTSWLNVVNAAVGISRQLAAEQLRTRSHTLRSPLNFCIITNLSCGCRKHWQAKAIKFNVFLIVLLGKGWIHYFICQVILLLFSGTTEWTWWHHHVETMF